MKTMPRVSVIIPAHNAEKYLEKCLLSLKRQSFSDWEAIVVDDGSADGTSSIAEKYARVLKLDRNSGEGAARNEGARIAGGEIVAFTDADVVLPPDWLEKIVRNLEDRGVKCVGGGYCGPLGDSFMENFAYYELLFRRRNMPEFVSTLVANNFACYKDVFFEFGGFPEKYKSEDLRLSYLIGRKYRILWDRDNGVYHHFRRDIKGYLKQQYYFARDTVHAYYEQPGLFFVKTHQGRGLYLEIILMLLSTVSLCFYPFYSLLFLAGILLLNIPFLRYLRSNGVDLPKSICTIYLRDLVCAFGVVSGIILCLNSAASALVKVKKGSI